MLQRVLRSASGGARAGLMPQNASQGPGNMSRLSVRAPVLEPSWSLRVQEGVETAKSCSNTAFVPRPRLQAESPDGDCVSPAHGTPSSSGSPGFSLRASGGD